MSGKNHACWLCDKRFRSADALAHHCRDKHGSPLPFKEKAKPLEIEPVCIECGSMAELVGGEAIYPHRPDLYSKSFYRCQCGAYCGCHPNTTVALGFPCGPQTRAARSAAHAAFDPIWKRGSLSRAEAYARLSAYLKIDPAECHIGMMTAERAREVVDFVNTRIQRAA